MKIKNLCLLLLSMTIMACANPVKIMVNPTTGGAVECSASGWGWLGAPIALSMAHQCVEKYEAVGFITEKSYIEQGGDPAKIKMHPVPTLIFSSDPQGATIYVSNLEQNNFIELKDKTPVTLFGATGSQYWQAECYKAILNGKESEIICKEENEVSRYVYFTFE